MTMNGPDFRHVDSREKAEALYRRGELVKLLLFPAEFGGEDIPPNTVYVPAYAAELKRGIDQNTILPLVQEGRVRQYAANAEYEGASFIPTLIRIVAGDPGGLEMVVKVWGAAVHPVRAAAPSLDGLGPEDVVRAFIAAYAPWNDFANRASARDSTAGMRAAEAAYAKLIARFCLPGHRAQPVSFGDESTHDASEEIVDVEYDTPEFCVVKTRKVKSMYGCTFTDDYEYHLEKEGARWYLTSVLYVAEDGKYEGL